MDRNQAHFTTTVPLPEVDYVDPDSNLSGSFCSEIPSPAPSLDRPLDISVQQPKKNHRKTVIEQRSEILRLTWDLIWNQDLEDDYRPIYDRVKLCQREWVVLRHTIEKGLVVAFQIYCGSRFCPVCTQSKSFALRERLSEVIDLAFTHWILTIRTPSGSSMLPYYLDVLANAWRHMSQCKGGRSAEWHPFSAGYFWKLEITDSPNQFHPHLHVLSTEKFIDKKSLETRWRRALSYATYKGNPNKPTNNDDLDEILQYNTTIRGYCWVSSVDKTTLRELSKYMTKNILKIDSEYWPLIFKALHKRRLYGSGGDLKIRPFVNPSRGYEFLGLARRTKSRLERGKLQECDIDEDLLDKIEEMDEEGKFDE